MSFENVKVAMALTGGGSLAPAQKLAEGGNSGWLVDVAIPYGQEALDDYLKPYKVEKYCSWQTAEAMAAKALERCEEYHPEETCCGVGVSCSLAKKEDEREGRVHQIFIVFNSRSFQVRVCWSASASLLSRREEERVAADVIDMVLSAGAGEVNDHSDTKDSTLFQWGLTRTRGVDLLKELARTEVAGGKFEVTTSYDDGCRYEDYLSVKEKKQDIMSSGLDRKKDIIVVSGSFNPLHAGHEHLFCEAMKWAETRPNDNYAIAYELSLVNRDKPPVQYFDYTNRLEMGLKNQPLIVTNAPGFVDKYWALGDAGYRNIVFVVGSDTFNRIETKELQIMGALFIAVNRPGFPKVNESGIRENYVIVPDTDSLDISSTELRNAQDI